ncbi:hypothetical protein N7510_008359 [Penicillium lagena]|uniref:uncharacterized protein n=1 Tax=Penicillium lagena TaxID=94218 RepID=UPI002541B0D2|nr:uncharacterized protein N7510_008359 [Penicillium lagena]KAJ5605578.1 hypothetical protein N7510_008359 [Penicillium lagena]
MDTEHEPKMAVGHIEQTDRHHAPENDPKGEEHVDLNHNVSAKIRNPLAHLSKVQLLEEVELFSRENDLEDALSLLKKGALIAQSDDFETLNDLVEEDRQTLRREKTHKWSQTKQLYLTIVLCSIGAAVQGWDQTGANGANLSFPQEFGIDPTTGTPNYQRNEWLLGLVNGAPHIGASFCGCWLSDPINHYVGRRGTILFSAIFCMVPVLCQAFTQSWPELFLCRLLLGVGWGCKASIIPVFAAENSPAYIRGGLVMSWQLYTGLGIMLGFATNLIFYHVGTIAWRLQLASAFVPAVPLALFIYFCPESPRWYMKKGRAKDAYASLCRLRKTPLQAARDLYYMHSQLQMEASLVNRTSNYFKRFTELFTIPRNRRAVVASFVVMMSQQMCGVNIISYYSSSIFSSAGASTLAALLFSFGFGAINFVFAFPAVKLIDQFGRRSLLLVTFPLMTITLIGTAMCFFTPEDSKAHLGLIALFIYLFAICYSPGAGPVPFTYSAEVFPLSHREVGMSWAVASINFWGFVLSLTFFRIEAAFTIEGAFGFYAGLNVLCFCLIFCFLPETKKRTLEELDYVFGVPTGTFIRYQFTKVVPYFVRRYCLFDKSARLEPLYQLDHITPN